MTLSKCDLKVARLKELGVETCFMAFTYQKTNPEVHAYGSDAAVAFLDLTDTTNSFAMHFQGTV